MASAHSLVGLSCFSYTFEQAACCAFRDFDIEPKAEFLNFTYDLEAFAKAVDALEASSYIPPGKGYVSDLLATVLLACFSWS